MGPKKPGGPAVRGGFSSNNNSNLYSVQLVDGNYNLLSNQHRPVESSSALRPHVCALGSLGCYLNAAVA